MRRRAAPLVAVLALLAGCGQGDGVSSTAAARLEPHVAAARAAAERGDSEGAAAELAALRVGVSDLLRQGQLEERQAVTILDASVEVETELARLPTTTTTTTAPPATTTAPPTTTTPSGEGQPKGKDKKEDKGRGDDDEDDGDD